ncbi:hypothetical protein Q0P93_15110, partial [Staphylococcus aureus]|nr:hypothetical protein [Staphylococcus aureus]
ARFLADQSLVIILVMIRDDGDFTLEDRPRTIIVLILELMVKRQAKLGSAELPSKKPGPYLVHIIGSQIIWECVGI